MPTAPPTACVEQPCPGSAVERGRCAVHLQSTTERGYGSVHQAEARSARNGAHCVICGSTENLQRGHRIPTSLGGSQDPANKEWMCATCHPKYGLRRDSRAVFA